MIVHIEVEESTQSSRMPTIGSIPLLQVKSKQLPKDVLLAELHWVHLNVRLYTIKDRDDRILPEVAEAQLRLQSGGTQRIFERSAGRNKPVYYIVCRQYMLLWVLMSTH